MRGGWLFFEGREGVVKLARLCISGGSDRDNGEALCRIPGGEVGARGGITHLEPLFALYVLGLGVLGVLERHIHATAHGDLIVRGSGPSRDTRRHGIGNVCPRFIHHLVWQGVDKAAAGLRVCLLRLHGGDRHGCFGDVIEYVLCAEKDR